jgi:hypothetical protein
MTTADKWGVAAILVMCAIAAPPILLVPLAVVYMLTWPSRALFGSIEAVVRVAVDRDPHLILLVPIAGMLCAIYYSLRRPA